MSILEQILGYQGDHPKDVAQAYYDVKQQIAKDVGERENSQWKSLFDTAKLQGASPADLHDPATGANASGMVTGPSELERWKMQIDGLITSGNPVLQEQGLSMLAAYRQRATAPESKTDGRPTSVKEYAYAVQNGYKGTYPEWVQSKKARMYQPTLTSTSDAKNNRVRPEMLEEFKKRFGRDQIGAGMVLEEVAPYMYPVDPKREEEAFAASNIMTEFENQLFADDGIYSDWGDGFFNLYKNATNASAQKFLQNDPKYRAYEDAREGFVALVAKSLGETGNLAIPDIERAKKLIPSATLPFPDSPAVARIKMDTIQRIIAANKSGEYNKISNMLDKAEQTIGILEKLPEGFKLEE